MNIAVLVCGAILVFSALILLYREAAAAVKETRIMLSVVKEVSRWVEVPCSFLFLGHYIDYNYPFLIHHRRQESLDPLDRYPDDEAIRASTRRALSEGLNKAVYRYSFKGRAYKQSSIAPIRTIRDREKLFELCHNEAPSALVNPKDPFQSYLFNASRADFWRYIFAVWSRFLKITIGLSGIVLIGVIGYNYVG